MRLPALSCLKSQQSCLLIFNVFTLQGTTLLPPSIIRVMNGKVTNQQPDPNPGMDASEREWKKGLFVAMNPSPICWYSCLCPCPALQRNQNHLQYIRSRGTDDSIDLDDKCPMGVCCAGQAAFCCMFGPSIIIPFMQRQEVRKYFHIRGNPVKDCLVSACCVVNLIAQEAIELQDEVAKLRGYGLHESPDVQQQPMDTPAPTYHRSE